MAGIARRVVTLGRLTYGIGGALMVSGIALLGADDIRGPVLLIALGIMLAASGLLNIHEERYHTK